MILMILMIFTTERLHHMAAALRNDSLQNLSCFFNFLIKFLGCLVLLMHEEKLQCN